METNRQKQWKTAINSLTRNTLAVICFAVLVVEILLVLLAGVIAPFEPEAVDASIKLSPGFWAQWSKDPVEAAKYVPGHLFGTAHLGRDVL